MLGCLSNATNVRPHKGKFEPRAQKCVFIGFSPRQKAYKLYSLDSKQVIISRDVIFYENIFPFQSINDSQEQNSLPLPVTSDIDNIPNSSENYEGGPLSTIDADDDPHMEDTDVLETDMPHRHSTRQRRTPGWLNDFVVNSCCY